MSEKDKEKEFEELMKKADTLFEKKNIKESLEIYEQASKVNSKNADVFYLIGVCYVDLGKYEKGIDSLTRAIIIDPTFHEAFVNRGFAYNSIGKFTDAIVDCTQAIEYQPNDPEGKLKSCFFYQNSI